MRGNKNHSRTCQRSMERSWRLVEGHGSLRKVTEPCGAWCRIKEAHKRSYDMSDKKSWQKVKLWKVALWILSEYIGLVPYV
jgi:hypothetical protein